MKADFRSVDFAALTDAWNRFYGPKYAIAESLLRFNSVESALFDWGASVVDRDSNGEIAGFALVKKSAAGLYKGPDKDVVHLSAIAFRDPYVGSDLFSEVRGILRDRGASKLVYGMDSRHFFPGAPIDLPTLNNFLTIEGFSAGGEYFDLEADLQGYVNPAPIPDGFEFRPLTDADWPALDEFLAREFPHRWRYDVTSKRSVEGRCDFVYGVFEGGRCEGFALLQDASHKGPIGGAVWNQDLGDGWGSLGPIGVSKGIRGRGAGNALLGKALEHLSRHGIRQTIIDWTTLDKFYGAHGFKIARTYRSMTLALEQ